MFGIFSVIRFSQSAAVLLSVGLLTFAGCRCLSPKNSTPAPSPVLVNQLPVTQASEIHSPKTYEPDKYSAYAAFRPIIPEEFWRRTPAQPLPASQPSEVESPKEEPAPDIDVQSTIDELNQKIADLETQLEEAKKVPPPIPYFPPDSPQSDPLPIEKKETGILNNLPVINKPGVTVYRDDSQDLRIVIADTALFVPNVWQLTAVGEETLRTIAAEIKAADAKALVEIEGHTDSLIGDPSNPMQKHEISSVKTRAIMDFFVDALRWDSVRIRTSSFGHSRPVADNETPEGRAKNNRIEIVVRCE